MAILAQAVAEHYIGTLIALVIIVAIICETLLGGRSK